MAHAAAVLLLDRRLPALLMHLLHLIALQLQHLLYPLLLVHYGAALQAP
jgi:hypothetical protein